MALGIALILTGGALLVAEAHIPSYGALGFAGVAALATGTAFALTSAGGGVVFAVLLAATIAAAGTAALVLAGRRPPAPLGQVQLDGALWHARRSWGDDDATELGEGDHVVVDRVNGLTLA